MAIDATTGQWVPDGTVSDTGFQGTKYVNSKWDTALNNQRYGNAQVTPAATSGSLAAGNMPNVFNTPVGTGSTITPTPIVQQPGFTDNIISGFQNTAGGIGSGIGNSLAGGWDYVTGNAATDALNAPGAMQGVSPDAQAYMKMQAAAGPSRASSFLSGTVAPLTGLAGLYLQKQYADKQLDLQKGAQKYTKALNQLDVARQEAKQASYEGNTDKIKEAKAKEKAASAKV